MSGNVGTLAADVYSSMTTSGARQAPSFCAFMSVLGHELPSCGGSATSALRLKADILKRSVEVR
jgi:hypothetical protein